MEMLETGQQYLASNPEDASWLKIQLFQPRYLVAVVVVVFSNFRFGWFF